MADDSLATVTDWLGREQPLARKTLELSTSGGGGALTAPVTPSAEQRAQAVQQIVGRTPSSSSRTAQEILAGLQSARSAASQLAQLVPGNQPSSAVPSSDTPTASPTVTQGEQAGVGFGNTPSSEVLQGPATPGAEPTVSPTVTPGESSGTGFEGAGSAVEGGSGAAGLTTSEVLPYLGAAISISQDAMSNKENWVKGLDAAFDLAGAILSPYTLGLSSVASSFAKSDLDRLIPDVQHGDVLRAMFVDTIANPITLVSDIIQLFGGPDLTQKFFLESPGHHYTRDRQAAIGQANLMLENLAHGYRQVQDIPSALATLQASQGPIGTGVQVPPEVSQALGLPPRQGAYAWSELNPGQFNALLHYFREDPSRLDAAITGTADIRFLGEGIADQIAGNAKQLTHSLLGAIVNRIGPAAPPDQRTAPPVTTQGPAGALGFATDLLNQT